MLGFLSKTLGSVFGTKHDRDVKALLPLVTEANQHYAALDGLSHDELRQKTNEFRARIAEYLAVIDGDIGSLQDQATHETDIARKEALFEQIDKFRKERDEHLEVVLRAIMPEAFAVVKQAAARLSANEQLHLRATEHDHALITRGKKYLRYTDATQEYVTWDNTWDAAGTAVRWNMVHYDVQLIGGMVLHDGKISEMATGEGKTLVATLPAYLNGVSGEGVHIVTVNDYLARRDSEWNGPLYEFLLLSCDCIDKYQPNTEARRKAYLSDIVYGTNNEFGFDYLRDNMVTSPDELVQRKHHYAIVDEVDSVLIDDARTPLIISGPVPVDNDREQYQAFVPVVAQLHEAQRVLVTRFLSEARKKIESGDLATDEKDDNVGGGLMLFRAYRGLPKYRPLIKYLSETGIKTLLQKTENVYLQEQAKNMPVADEPLLFVIDEKNNSVELTQRGFQELAKITGDAGFFVMPDITSELVKLQKTEGLTDDERVVAREKLMQDFAVKSRRLHSMQQLLKAYTLFDKEIEYLVVDGEIKIVDESTGRILEGRRYSDGLHQAIEAKEGVEIKDATQTYASVTLQNYFRMYHKLAGMTGTAETEAQEFWQIYKLDVVTIPTNRPMTRLDEEDLVYKTVGAKYNAVIEEIVRLNEAGRPSLVGTTSVEESEKLSRLLTRRGIKHNVLNAKNHLNEAQIVAEAGQTGAVTIATNMAGRGTDIKLGLGVKEAGGLAIIGTERHDSRRVDRQLRGRAGRQGDPGTTQFFVSLEDSLMRKFGSERLAGFMDRMGYKEDEVIQHSMVTKSIERSQKKVEENNFGIRKRLLEYDDVMNIQRSAIYKKRNNALFGERLSIDLNNMFLDLAYEIVAINKSTNDYAGFRQDSYQYFGIEPSVMEEEYKASKGADAVAGKFQNQVFAAYHEKADATARLVLPVIRQVYETERDRYSNIAIPYTDGIRELSVVVDMKAAIDSDGATVTTEIEKGIALALIDLHWKEHLRNLDDLRDTVQSASFEQKDPLVLYKLQAFNLFQDLIGVINRDVVAALSRGVIPIEEASDVQQAPSPSQQRQQKQQERDRRSASRSKGDNQSGITENRSTSADDNDIAEELQKQLPIHSEKIGRNDLCPCGSGKKFKNCHGR